MPRYYYHIVALVALVATGCSTIDTRPQEEIVEERALAQAQALVNQDYEAALSYVTPSYQEGPRADFYAANHSGSAFWKRTEVRWVRCDNDPEVERCSVRIWVYGTIPSSGRVTSDRGDTVPASLDSVWIKIEGQWYQYLE